MSHAKKAKKSKRTNQTKESERISSHVSNFITPSESVTALSLRWQKRIVPMFRKANVPPADTVLILRQTADMLENVMLSIAIAETFENRG